MGIRPDHRIRGAQTQIAHISIFWLRRVRMPLWLRVMSIDLSLVSQLRYNPAMLCCGGSERQTKFPAVS